MEGRLKIALPVAYFGGKSTVAHLVWERFGDVPNYVEPFAGSLAVLLARPTEAKIETVNDMNAWICNFFRAVSRDPDAVAAYASDPVSELDLHARGDWLFYREGAGEFVERIRNDPDYYCAKSAGWWVWGQSSWIGSGWGLGRSPQIKRQRPHLADAGKGVNRKRPLLWRGGAGVNRKLPQSQNDGTAITDTTRKAAITEYMRQLAERLCRVRICCGDWERVCGPSPTHRLGMTGVFLDPPYGVADRDDCYGEHEDRDVASRVRAWCITNQDNPLMRIALCGYDGEHELPGWECIPWKANGGYALLRTNGKNDNKHRERIWFSPACQQVELFA